MLLNKREDIEEYTKQLLELDEAAAVLARLEEGLPKLAVEIGAMADYLEDKWNFCDENSEGDFVDHVPIEVTEDFPKQLRAILSRLDAPPKEKRMIAYLNDPKIKTGILAQLAAHRKADELIQGFYWQKGKGCAVGCTIHSGNHAEYETRFGIPIMLAYLEDRIFEGLANGQSKEWPERFMGAIKPGSDLSRVGWRFLHWRLTDEKVNPGIKHPLVADAVAGCAEIMAVLIRDGRIDQSAAWSAEIAARSAEIAARSAVESAARSAEIAARSAEIAARSAESAASAESAESAAWSATSAAWSAESAAESAEYSLMADKLVELLESAPKERS